MVSGKELSERERQFINDNKDKMFPSQLAKELAHKFPDDNNRYRSPRVIREVLKSAES